MSRQQDILLGGQAYGQGITNPMLNVAYGGQEGWAPNYTQWLSNQAYIKRNLVCILLEAPGFFKYMPNSSLWTQILKSLVETQTRTIEGFNAALEVATEEHPVGGAGEVQEEFTNITRQRSEPEFTFIEKYGMPIATFFYNWMVYGMMDPEAKYPMVTTLSGAKPTDLLADQYSMTCLFFEPDPLHQTVIKAWITTNMFPKATGEITARRDMTAAGEMTTLTVPFSGLSQFGLGVNVFAQKILDSINLTNANPYLRPSFLNGVSPTVAAATQNGYVQGAENLGNTAIAR